MKLLHRFAVLSAFAIASTAAQAQLKVGIDLSSTGPAAAIGISIEDVRTALGTTTVSSPKGTLDGSSGSCPAIACG